MENAPKMLLSVALSAEFKVHFLRELVAFLLLLATDRNHNPNKIISKCVPCVTRETRSENGNSSTQTYVHF